LGFRPAVNGMFFVEVVFFTTRILAERKSDDFKNTRPKNIFFAYEKTFKAKSLYF
jgi:hypothetical protein